MTKRLIIDPMVAAQNLGETYQSSWVWPITSSATDEAVVAMYAQLDEIHSSYVGSERIWHAYLLVKSDLLKELSYFVAAAIDIYTIKNLGFEPVYRSDKFIFQAVDRDTFPNISPIERARGSANNGIRSRVRQVASRLKRQRANNNSLKHSETEIFSTSPNPLGRQIAPKTTLSLRLTNDDVIRSRNQVESVPQSIAEFAARIRDATIDVMSHVGQSPTPKFSEHIFNIADRNLRNGWIDAGAPSFFTPKKSAATLITGTGSGYSARLLAYQFMVSGHRVIRTTHGGDQVFWAYNKLWSAIEIPYCSDYVFNGEKSASIMNSDDELKPVNRREFFSKSFISVGSNLHAGIRASADVSQKKMVQTVSVISASFTGMYRITPFMKLHDVAYLEWHRRLLREVKGFGYSVISKRHPKGLLVDQYLFSDITHNELLQTPMSEIYAKSDAYVIDFISSAFMEAICTMKPVVFIDIPIRKMRPEVREQISKSVTIVQASIDDDNRVTIDNNQLRLALQTPVNISAREELIEDFLTRPSVESRVLFE